MNTCRLTTAAAGVLHRGTASRAVLVRINLTVLLLERPEQTAGLVQVGVVLALNMFCQYIKLWMYVVPAADLYLWRPPTSHDRSGSNLRGRGRVSARGRLTAAIPVDNPYCSCKPTRHGRVEPVLQRGFGRTTAAGPRGSRRARPIGGSSQRSARLAGS